MSSLPISRSALDRLGKRLAASDIVSDEDSDLLLEVLSAYQAALDEVQQRLAAVGYRATSRVKTTRVLIDKIRREHSSLKSVQDIAGARIVADCDRIEQDEIVKNIVESFAAAERPVRVKDRRAGPNNGYRAVHVIVTAQGLPVEIQVRTDRQDQWAQIVESLGDKWGRGIRYGEPPPEPERPVVGGVRRRRIWELVLELSERIDVVETVQVALRQLESAEGTLAAAALDPDGEAASAAYEADVEELKTDLAAAETSLANDLRMFGALVEDIPE